MRSWVINIAIRKNMKLWFLKTNKAVKMYNNAGFRTVYENAEEHIMVCEL